MLLQIQGAQRKINIVQVYAPTSENRYDEEVLNRFFSNEIKMIMGDSKIGERRRGDLVGPFGLDKSNDRGDLLLYFCEINDLVGSQTVSLSYRRGDYIHDVIMKKL